MTRKSGILMPIFSLPSKHYIGDFGAEAYKFIDIIKENNFKIWQILPLNPVGYGNSPYQPYSSYAGEEIYISLDKLKEWGLISEIENIDYNNDKADYEKARIFKAKYFKKAFENMMENGILKEEFDSFKKENSWVYNYSVFITLKKENDLKCWNDWKEKDKNWITEKTDLSQFKEKIEY